MMASTRSSESGAEQLLFHTINTDEPFHAKIEFYESHVQTTLTQDDRSQIMEADTDYMNKMSIDLENGMGFVVSNWGGDASWLWKDRCSGDCNWPKLSVSNISIKTGLAPPTPPTDRKSVV